MLLLQVTGEFYNVTYNVTKSYSFLFQFQTTAFYCCGLLKVEECKPVTLSY